MMKKKRIVAMLTAAAIAVSLTGCGTSASDGTSAASGGGNQGESGTADENTLTVWCWDPAFNIRAIETAGKLYQKDHSDFNLQIIETPWEDVQTKLTTAATSGNLDTLPDILLMQDNAFQKNVISYPDAFLDITSSGIDFSEFSQAKVAYSTVDGKNYGVPFDNGAVIAAYRTDILEMAGYTIEDFTDITWSEYLEKGRVVLEKTGLPLLTCKGNESDVAAMMLQSAGASFFDENGEPDMADNEALKEVVSTYAELVKAGVMVEVNDWDQYIGSMTNSSVAGTINGCWIMASIQTAEDQAGKWEITNIPRLDNVPGATNYSNNGGSSWAITTNCKNKELAQDFMAETFAGSTELYEEILPATGALTCYLPAADSPVYSEPQEFYNGQSVFTLITDYAAQTPGNHTGVYYYEAKDAIAVAITNVVAGGDPDKELKNAEDTVNFVMGK